MKTSSRINKEEITRILEKEEYEVYGLRVDDRIYNVGDICSPSHQLWQDEVEGLPYDEELGFWVGEELNGTCSIGIDTQYGVDSDGINKALALIEYYEGEHVYLIAGDYCEGGNDEGEYIIGEAKVLAVY